MENAPLGRDLLPLNISCAVTEPPTLGIDGFLFSTTIPGIPVSFSDKSVDVFGNSTPFGPGFILITGAFDIVFLLLEIPELVWFVAFRNSLYLSL